MQIIFAMIIAYLVFVSPTWAITRLVVLLDVGLAMLYELTPLRLHFGIIEPVALTGTLILWAVNLIVERRTSTSR